MKANSPQGIIGSQINQAQAMQSLGFYRRSQQLLEQIERQLQALPDSHLKVQGLLNIANLLQIVGEIERSQEILTEILEIAQKISSPQDKSQILLSLGNTEWSLGKKATTARQTQIAQNYFFKALEHYQAVETIVTSDIIKIQAQLNQLNLHIENPQLDSIPNLGNQIINKLPQLTPNRESIYARINFARSLIEIKNRKLGIDDEVLKIGNYSTREKREGLADKALQIAS